MRGVGSDATEVRLRLWSQSRCVSRRSCSPLAAAEVHTRRADRLHRGARRYPARIGARPRTRCAQSLCCLDLRDGPTCTWRRLGRKRPHVLRDPQRRAGMDHRSGAGSARRHRRNLWRQPHLSQRPRSCLLRGVGVWLLRASNGTCRFPRHRVAIGKMAVSTNAGRTWRGMTLPGCVLPARSVSSTRRSASRSCWAVPPTRCVPLCTSRGWCEDLAPHRSDAVQRADRLREQRGWVGCSGELRRT